MLNFQKMEINWVISSNDIERVRRFVDEMDNPFVTGRISRNVKREGVVVDKNSILKCMIMCLVTSQQRSGPDTPVSRFFRLEPFPVTFENISGDIDVGDFLRVTMQQNRLYRYINRISGFFACNFRVLQNSDWSLIDVLKKRLDSKATKKDEREIADYIDDTFKGFGPKQSRNFLQSLGLTIYEIPIDSRITNWLNDFGFPVNLSGAGLQDRAYYHFVSDGIQHLCDEASVYPCVLDAAIFSSYDSGGWNAENVVY